MFHDEHYAKLENTKSRLCEEAFEEFSKISNPEFVKDFSILVAWGFREEDDSAGSIVRRLDIEPMHLAAILDDDEWLEKELQDKALCYFFNDYTDC